MVRFDGIFQVLSVLNNDLLSTSFDSELGRVGLLSLKHIDETLSREIDQKPRSISFATDINTHNAHLAPNAIHPNMDITK